MATNFPISPSLKHTYSSGETTWRWTGVSWIVVPSATLTIENLIVDNLTVNSEVTNISLDDLSNVNAPSPTNQQILGYNEQTLNWEPITVNLPTPFNGGTITNPLVINNTGESTSLTSGALRVSGGVAVTRNLFIGGTAIVEDEELQLRARSQIKLFNTDNTRFIGLRAPATITVDRTYVLPGTDGSAGQFLRTNGSGVLTWASAATESGGTPAGGLTGQIQFNDSETFAGDAGLTFDAETQLFSAPNATVSGSVNMTATTESTSTTTGVLKVSGGAAITKQLNVGGAVNKFTGDTNSTSTTTGTIIVTGGMGISNEMHVGSTVSADTAPTNAEHLTNKRYVDANVLAFSVAFGA